MCIVSILPIILFLQSMFRLFFSIWRDVWVASSSACGLLLMLCLGVFFGSAGEVGSICGTEDWKERKSWAIHTTEQEEAGFSFWYLVFSFIWVWYSFIWFGVLKIVGCGTSSSQGLLLALCLWVISGDTEDLPDAGVLLDISYVQDKYLTLLCLWAPASNNLGSERLSKSFLMNYVFSYSTNTDEQIVCNKHCSQLREYTKAISNPSYRSISKTIVKLYDSSTMEHHGNILLFPLHLLVNEQLFICSRAK